MGKLILKSSRLHSLNDSENVELGDFHFDIKQFKVPTAMLVQKTVLLLELKRKESKWRAS